jgi:hypothetical protein
MSDRTFRLILDGKKRGLVKASTSSSAAKKAYKKLSAEQMKDKVLKTEPGKTSFKFELQETTKDSKKKVYGPYKGHLEKDKIKVKMLGGFTVHNGYLANNEGNNNGKQKKVGKNVKTRPLLNNNNNNNPSGPYGYAENEPDIIKAKKIAMKENLKKFHQLLLEKNKGIPLPDNTESKYNELIKHIFEYKKNVNSVTSKEVEEYLKKFNKIILPERNIHRVKRGMGYKRPQVTFTHGNE